MIMHNIHHSDMEIRMNKQPSIEDFFYLLFPLNAVRLIQG